MIRVSKERAQKRLEDARRDLEQLENRLALSHGLGDTNRASGIEAAFQNNPVWQKERERLRRMVEFYEDYIAFVEGNGPRPASPIPSTLADFIPPR